LSLYLDASALAKLYLKEDGSAETLDRVQGEPTAASTLLTRVEVPAAIARAARMRTIDRQAASNAIARFERDWPDFLALPVTGVVASRAASLAVSHGLRAYDAVHLASALTWANALAEPVVFATFDHALWRAAHDEGLDAWPEGLGR
jgi:uncharacterized protein